MTRRYLSTAVATLSCLMLTVCTAQTTTPATWVKAGTDDQTIARELADWQQFHLAAEDATLGIHLVDGQLRAD